MNCLSVFFNSFLNSLVIRTARQPCAASPVSKPLQDIGPRRGSEERMYLKRLYLIHIMYVLWYVFVCTFFPFFVIITCIGLMISLLSSSSYTLNLHEN